LFGLNGAAPAHQSLLSRVDSGGFDRYKIDDT
jgi:hypothetical protein